MAQKTIVQATSVPSEKPASGKSAPKVASPEDKKQALTLRLIAALLWAIAIGAEIFTIFWLLKRTELDGFLYWLIGAIVVIGIFALIGSQLWKKSNQLDPAKRSKPFRFFVQNQLGAIITIIAFVPLIILIFLNKDMNQKDRTIAGIVGIVALLAVGAASVDWNPPSAEETDELTGVVMAYTGKNEVFWVSGGSVYHLCAELNGETISPLAKGDPETNPIVAGTVAQALDAGKTRLSMYGFKECGYTEGEPAYPHYLNQGSNQPNDPGDDEPDDDEPGDEPS